MEKHVEERFERIERNLERVSERMDQITEAHIEIEAAQRNTSALLDRVIEEERSRGREIDERIANLTILVDRLIAKDLGSQA